LDEDVDHVAVLIHRTPEILPLAVDCHEDFVQEPRIPETVLPSFQFSRIFRTELPAPSANRFVRHSDPSFGEQILDVPETDAESRVKPDCVTDDLARIAVTVIEGSVSFHPVILAVMAPS
jgi:hypothetical protein